MGLIVQKGVPYPNSEYTIHELTDVNDSNKSDGSSLVYNAANSKYESKAITKSITYAEYQALSEEEKNNGTVYFVTDVNGDSQNFQPVIYSEEEREIGVWADGKPLYERVIDLEADTSISYNSWTLTTVSLSGIDRLVLIQGLNSSGTAFFGDLLGGNNNDYLQLQTSRNGDTVAVRYLIFRYTKTTDVAGSGTWTPQGVPAVHYSEDEHIIGTWIDGKTLYEISLETTQTFTKNAWTNISDLSALNIDEIVDSSSWFTYENGASQIDSSYLALTYLTNTGMLQGIQKVSTASNVAGTARITIRYTKNS